MPTIAKRLTFLNEEKTYTIPEIIEFCENASSSLKAYKNIAESQELIEQNYQLMQLYSPNISIQTKNKIKYIIKNSELTFNKTNTNGMMLEDGISKLNWSDLFLTFKKMVLNEKRSKI